MRVVLLLLLAALSPRSGAQTASSGSSRPDGTALRHGLQLLDGIEPSDERAIPDLANDLLRSLGRPWEDVLPTFPEPDSSAVENSLGEAWWSVSRFPVDGFRAFVQDGRVESVTLDFSPEGPDLAAVARRLYHRLGSPRADGFYATDQTGYPFSLAIDAQGNRLTARVVPGHVARRD